jgi:hypothetical protein
MTVVNLRGGAQVRAPLAGMLVVDCLPALIDTELPTLFPDEVLSILPSDETCHGGISANAARDFNHEGPVTGI